MRARVIRNHPGEGQFPVFKKGTRVVMADDAESGFLGWRACDIEGYKTYAPEIFVCDGALTRDYDPTELVQQAGDIIEVREIVHAWLIATNEKGTMGWIPAEIVVSVDETTCDGV